MKLKTAITSVIDLRGVSILNDSVVINLLNDFNGFSDYPSSKSIFKNLINEGIMEKILLAHSTNVRLGEYSQKYINELHDKLGVRRDIASYVINSIISSLGYDVEHFTQENVNERLTQNNKLTVGTCTEEGHLTFKGIEINGPANIICKKLKKKGFPVSAKMDFGYALKGTFAGNECTVLIYESVHTGNVWRIGVCFAQSYSWSLLKNEYFRFKKILAGNYGDPEVSVERILPPYKDGDGNEFMALARGKGECQSVFIHPNGRIHLAIGVDDSDTELARIIIFYDDAINYQENELAETDADINEYLLDNEDEFDDDYIYDEFDEDEFEDDYLDNDADALDEYLEDLE